MAEGRGQTDSGSGFPTKPVLLEKIRDGFTAMMAVVEGLDDRALVEVEAAGEWSIKDNLAHIAAWEEILLHFHIQGEPFEAVLGLPHARYRVTPYDELNDHLTRRDRALAPAEVMSRLWSGHQAVMEALDRLTEDEWMAPRPWLDTPEGPSGPLAQYIAWNTYEHYDEHLATIKRLAGSK